MTGRDGSFEIGPLEGSSCILHVRAHRSPSKSAWSHYGFEPGIELPSEKRVTRNSGDLILRLPRADRRALRFVDDTGRPVEVAVHPKYGTRQLSLGLRSRAGDAVLYTRSADPLEASFQPVPHENYIPAEPKKLAKLAPTTFEFARGGRIVGRVHTKPGVPLRGIEIEAQDVESGKCVARWFPTPSFRKDRRFEVVGVPVGEVCLSVRALGYPEYRSGVVAASRGVTLQQDVRLEQGGAVVLTVEGRESDGSVQIFAESLTTGHVYSSFPTHNLEDGSYEYVPFSDGKLLLLCPDDYSIRVVCGNRTAKLDVVRVLREKEERVTIRLK